MKKSIVIYCLVVFIVSCLSYTHKTYYLNTPYYNIIHSILNECSFCLRVLAVTYIAIKVGGFFKTKQRVF